MPSSILHVLTVGTLVCAAAISTVTGRAADTAPANPDRRPNILWILTDDQRPDSIAAFNRAVTGESESPLGFVASPAADALAEAGVLFPHAYCNAPICAPSRASMHTGQYPFRNGVYGFENFHNREPFSRQLIPEVLAEAGYDTMVLGKLHVKRRKPAKNWHAGRDTPFDTLMEYYDIRNPKIPFGMDFDKSPHVAEDGAKYWKERFYFPDGTVHEVLLSDWDNELPPDEQAKTDAFDAEHEILRAHTRKFQQHLILGGESTMPKEDTFHGHVNRTFFNYLNHPDQTFAHHIDSKKKFKGPDTSKPVFMNIGYDWPHTPVLPPKEFRDQYKNRPYDIPEFSRKELEKLPPQLRLFFEKFQIVDMTDAERLQVIQDYYAFCAYGDWLLGEAVKAFKKFSDKQNRPWVIVYTIGDHSWHLGENGVSCKTGPYNMSNRCAIIAASSDKSIFPADTVCDALVELVDLAPTFFSLAGIDTDTPEFQYLDGYSLMDVLNENKTREYVLMSVNHGIGPRAAIRDKNFVFSMRSRPGAYRPVNGVEPDTIKWALEAPEEDVEMTLFDLRNDPLERNNVANDPEYRELASWFREKLGNIVLGDGRIEANWNNDGEWHRFDFAEGSDDKKLAIPPDLIPAVN